VAPRAVAAADAGTATHAAGRPEHDK
jgi:hypothetical protein